MTEHCEACMELADIYRNENIKLEAELKKLQPHGKGHPRCDAAEEHIKQLEVELERLRAGIREHIAFCHNKGGVLGRLLEKPERGQLRAGIENLRGLLKELEEPVYDVNKCSYCVQEAHSRCHGPCNCKCGVPDVLPDLLPCTNRVWKNVGRLTCIQRKSNTLCDACKHNSLEKPDA